MIAETLIKSKSLLEDRPAVGPGRRPPRLTNTVSDRATGVDAPDKSTESADRTTSSHQGAVSDRVGRLLPEAIGRRLGEQEEWRGLAEQMVEEVGREAQTLAEAERTEHLAAVASVSQAIARSYVDSAVLQGRQGRWYAALKSAQQAVQRAQTLTALGVSPAVVEATLVKSHLQQSYARFMLEGNSPQLRTELRQAQRQYPKAEGLAKWTAHYHVMAGQLGEAREALAPVLDLKKIQPPFMALRALTHPLEAGATELAYPCNFYTYRYELVSDEVIEAMQGQVKIVSTWDPANRGVPPFPEALQKVIDEAAKEAGQQAREAELARAAAQDQSRSTDDLHDEQEYDAGGSMDEGGRRIFYKPKRKPTYKPAISAAQKDQAATAAGARAATAAALQTSTALKTHVNTADNALDALSAWNAAIRAFRHQNYAAAILYFRDCRVAALRYFSLRYATKDKQYPVPNTEEGVYTTLCAVARDMIGNNVPRPPAAANMLIPYWRTRHQLLELEGRRGGIKRFDWFRPTQPFVLKTGKTENPLTDAVDMLTMLNDATRNAQESQKIEEKLDAPLLTLALVHVSLGIGEARRFNRDFDGAISECRKLESRHADFKLLSQTIEVPFIELMKAHTLLEKGDAEYKGRMLAPDTNTALWPKYQGLIAADTYRGVLDSLRPLGGRYIARVETGIEEYNKKLNELLTLRFHPLAAPGSGAEMSVAQRQALRTLNTVIPIQSVIPRTVRKGSAGTPQQVHPQMHPLEPLLTYALENGQPVQDTNPLIYALIAQAKARLLQIEAGLNYLGYRDDYVPPWRFSFLLDRARYFAEHAKGAQRDYLNFLTNAEREEERETSARQAVVLAKSNLRIAEAKTDRSRSEVEGSKMAKELADLTAADANARAANFKSFDAMQDGLAAELRDGATGRQAEAIVGGTVAGAATGASIGALFTPVGAAIGAVIGGVVGAITSIFGSDNAEQQRNQELQAADKQRALELATLKRAAGEAAKAAEVAGKQLLSAKAGLVVSALEWAADLMNHEFSQQNYEYLLRRQLGAEQWYRLAHGIRYVSERYLRYAIEMAFLAEQAYEFEADKRINAIRFDYDASETGKALAGDFLLADLDTLEQDLVVTQQRKEQHVRFVVSLARDYPDALDQLRREGWTLIPLTLDRLERRFPGLYNIRVGGVEMLPIALMDPTRFSVQLTYAGAGQVRTELPVDVSGQTDKLPYLDSWIPASDARWPVKMQIGQVETTVFSGLSRADQQASFPFIMGSQRGAFERLPAAAVWHLTMSLKENQVLPGSLADVLLTFSLSGAHDAALQVEVEKAVPAREVLTRWFSAAQSFADGFYDFNQTGQLVVPITRDRLVLTGKVENLRNFGVVLVPSQDEPVFNAVTAGAALEFDVSSAGAVTVLTPTPSMTFSVNQLQLTATVSLPAGASAQWDFGDGSALVSGTPAQHGYSRPGKYTVIVRLSLDGRLLEYAAAVVVSTAHAVSPPLTVSIATPTATTGGTVPAGKVQLQATGVIPAGEDVALTWRLGSQPSNTTGVFIVDPGRYVLVMTAARALTARLYGRQRWLPTVPIKIAGLTVSTNRTFDVNGTPTNVAAYNDLARHLFSPGPLSPLDKWVLELPLSDNPHLRTVDHRDAESVNLFWLMDSLTAQEYEHVEEVG